MPDVQTALGNAVALAAMLSDQEFAKDFRRAWRFTSARTIAQLGMKYRRLAARADMAKRR